MLDVTPERARPETTRATVETSLEPVSLLVDEQVAGVKRLCDLVLVVLALPVILPVCLAIAVAIKIDSAGPVLFTQTRLGRGQRRFQLLKFRTMYQSAEAALETLLENDAELRREYDRYHKLRNDPRITPLGRVLRRYSLDELPQLWNILIGDMTLVGPRAYTPDELPEMEGAEGMILKIRPGLTGFWQAGGRNGVTFSERVSMDLFYIAHWSPWWDLILLICTVRILAFGKEAY